MLPRSFISSIPPDGGSIFIAKRKFHEAARVLELDAHVPDCRREIRHLLKEVDWGRPRISKVSHKTLYAAVPILAIPRICWQLYRAGKQWNRSL